MSETELVDILDEAGSPTGKVIPRGIAHKKGYLHASVHVWLFNKDGEVLIQRRAATKVVSGGYWTMSASGHVKAGVSFLQTAIDETKEELGVKLTKKELVYITNYRKLKHYPETGITDNEINPVFAATVNFTLNEYKLIPDDVEQIKYLSLKLIQQQTISKSIAFKPDRPEYFEQVIPLLKKFLADTKSN